MQVKIQKWGNSLAFRIPKAFAKEINIENGSFVDLSIEENRLVISPIDNQNEYDLSLMLPKIDESNIHTEIDFGESIGKKLL
jgi:antitoxin MazE